MAEPLIPYIQLPEIPLSFLEHLPWIGERLDPLHPPSIKPFGTLVALGVYIGSVIAVRHARQRSLDEKKMNEFIFWVVGAGFIGGHILDAVFYHPQRVMSDPLYLFALWDGLSSFGGFVGALCGGLAWRLFRGQGILPMADVIASVFPVAWVFGRAGCASVHDHPGRISDAWFAVKYPYGPGTIGRFDLGLYECLLTIPLAIAFAILWHRKPIRPVGFYLGVMCASYAPVRFALDFLREHEGTINGGDPRYAGLTPAQWACFGLFGLGLYFLRMASRGSTPGGASGGALSEAGAASEAQRAPGLVALRSSDDDRAADAEEPAAPAAPR